MGRLVFVRWVRFVGFSSLGTFRFSSIEPSSISPSLGACSVLGLSVSNLSKSVCLCNTVRG